MKKHLSFGQEIIGPTSLLTVGALYGLSAVIAKYLSSYITAYQVIELRFGIAFVAALAILLLAHQRLNVKSVDKKVLVAFAVTFPASAILFTLAVFHASVALAVFSFYAANLISQFILGGIFFGEKVNTSKGLALAAAAVSLVIFTNPFGSFAISLGLVFGIIAGVIQAVASAFQKLLSTSADKTSLLLVQTLTGTAMASIIILATNQSLLPSMSGSEWLITVVFGLIMLAIMYLFLVGYRYTNLNVGSVLVSSELFFAPVFAVLLLSEHLDANIIIGGILTGAAAILVSLPEKTTKQAD